MRAVNPQLPQGEQQTSCLRLGSNFLDDFFPGKACRPVPLQLVKAQIQISLLFLAQRKGLCIPPKAVP